MYDVWDATMDVDETADTLAERDWDALLRMFSFLRPVDAPCEDLTKEVVAYRVGIAYDEESDQLDEDFHFRVRRNGVWYEKQGTLRPHECVNQSIEDPWMTPMGDLEYNSKIYYAIIEI